MGRFDGYLLVSDMDGTLINAKTQQIDEGNLEENKFVVRDFATGRHTVIEVSTVADRHSGGDYYIMTDFIKLVREGSTGGRTEAKGAVDSHVMCFAAELSRLEDGKEIVLEEYKNSLR